MKFSISSEALLKPLLYSASVVESKSTKVILTSLLLQVSNSTLKVVGTDNEMTMVSQVSLCGDTTEGELCVNAKKIVEIVKAFESGCNLEFSLTPKGRLRIVSGNGRFELGGLDPAEFPSMAEEGLCSHWLKVDASLIKKKIAQTAFSMASQDVRPFLKGLYLKQDSSGLNVVTTDGHRLSLAKASNVVSGGCAEVIIPRKAVPEISKLLSETGDQVAFGIGDSHLQLDVGGFKFSTRLIEGKYPDYTRVIPKSFNYQVVIDREELKSCLGRVSVLTNDALQGVYFSFSQGTLQLSAINQDAEEGVEELPCDYSGPDLSIGLNVGYVLDVLSVLSGPVVLFNLVDDSTSVVVKSESDDESMFVIMPMRI